MIPAAPLLAVALAAAPLLAGLRPAPADRWDGSSRTVHEWGTFTEIRGSDGSVVPGLRHEDFDLPGFVHATPAGLVAQSPKMETPVVYFYSPTEWRLACRVRFPRGLVTHWFPAASAVNGAHAAPAPSVPTALLRDGAIDWGTAGELVVLPPGAAAPWPGVAADDPWRFARAVEANALDVGGRGGPWVEVGPRPPEREHERFLFYRGLGAFELPLVGRVRREVVGARDVELELELANRAPAEPLASARLVFVEEGRAAFLELGEIRDRREVDCVLELRPLAEVEDDLERLVAHDLRGAGLYADEALAMARTWRHAWFGDEGLRVLSILPRELVDRELPLEIVPMPRRGSPGTPVAGPGPDSIVRAFVARTELLSPRREARITAELERAAGGDLAARAECRRWGRFGAPFRARARALAPPPSAHARR